MQRIKSGLTALAVGIVLLAALDWAAAAATGAGTQRLLPDANLPIETMRIFDADLKWTIGVVQSKNIPISNVDLTLDLERGRLALSPLTFAMARGNVASDVVFDTRSRPSAATTWRHRNGMGSWRRIRNSPTSSARRWST